MVERNAAFDEWLNDAYGQYVIGALTFDPADILAYCDPIAYRISVSEWVED